MRIARRRRRSSGKRALAVSDRSGLSFPYREMVTEPGTKLWVHRTESDGRWNVVDYEKLLVAPTGDAQRLENPTSYAEQDAGAEVDLVTDFF